MSHEALMLYRPCAALHTRKTQQVNHKSKSISVEDQNISGQRMEDIFVGITTNNVYQKPNPQLKHSLKDKS